MRSTDGQQGQGDVCIGTDVRDKMSTVQTAHGVSEKVDSPSPNAASELFV